MKKLRLFYECDFHYLMKTFRIMRITLFLLLVSVLQAFANDTYSQKARLSLNFSNTRLVEAMDEIEELSEFFFLYNEKLVDIDREVSFSANNEKINIVLDKLFRGTDVVYTIIDRKIILAPSFLSQNQQQQKSVSGKVTDTSGQPLPGVTVQVKGSSSGTITNADGNYLLANVPGDATLVFSFIGMQTQEISVNNLSKIDVQLNTDFKAIDEVVVVGYGSQRRADVIGSVSQINAENINERATPQLRQALTGQLSGVTVIQRSGQPGAPGGSILIRGVGSFGAGTEPLVLVDGIPVNSMDNIDPNDVEKISVLKDASSAAIYGSRAANGVILITTKSGKSEKIKISYNAHFGVQRPSKFPKYVDSWEYAELLNEATGGGAGGYTDEEIQKFKDGSDPDHYPNVDYIDEIFKDNSVQTAHNLTISQKVGETQYLLSMGYLYQNGIIDKNDYNRYNIRLNLTSKLAKNLTLTTRLSGIQALDNQPNTPGSVPGNAQGTLGIIGWVLRYPAIYPAILSNGDYGLGLAGVGTPVSLLASDGFYKNKTTDLNSNARLDWDVFKNLKVSLIGGIYPVEREERCI